MAKKKVEETKVEETQEESTEKVWLCSKGHPTPTRRGRGQVCCVCGEAKPAATKAEPKKVSATVQQELDFGETIELLGKVKKYSEDFGGVEKLAEMVESLEEITMQCGGIDGLRKALEALKSL